MELSSSVKVNFNYFCGFQIVFWDSQTPSAAELFPLGRGWRKKVEGGREGQTEGAWREEAWSPGWREGWMDRVPGRRKPRHLAVRSA